MKLNKQVALSSGQKGLWLLHQLDPVSDRYHMPLTFTFGKDIQLSDWQQLLTAFVSRHDMLHSTFVQLAGAPVRQINEVGTVDITEYDYSGLSHNDLLQKIRALSSQPFNLAEGPLFRATLLNNTIYGDVLLINIHHMVFDGGSLKIMCDELQSLHHSIKNENPLQEVTHNYHDFVTWQQQWLKSEDAEASKQYWLQQLSGELPQLNLTADNHNEKVECITGDFIKFSLPTSVVSKFKQLAKDNSCSEYVVWLMAYFTFLSRYTSNADVIIGTPSMGRPDAQFDDIVGYFVNLIPLRCQIDSTESFNELLARYKNEIYAGLMHADYPLTELIKDLGDGNQRGDQPLFQSSFVWTVANHLKAKQDSSLDLNICPLIHESGEQSLSLEILTTDEGLNGLLKYRTNLFSPSMAKKIQSAFVNFIDSISIEPDSQITALSLVSEEEEDYLLHQLNDRSMAYPEDMCIHHMFEQQVKRNPGATAVEFEANLLTYAELNAQANQLAHYLVSQSESTDDMHLIGICTDRSIEMIIGILAILKAGAAYVPIDPSLPDNRRTHILNDSGIKVLLTQSHLLGLNENSVCLKITVDDPIEQQKWTDLSSSNPQSKITSPDNLAYVIYTSGSTGLPKGVMQTHRTMINLVHAQANHKGLNQPLRTLQFAPFSFDVSIQEICTCWHTGSPLILISQQQKENLHLMSNWLCKLNIERMFIPPAVLNWLTDDLLKQSLTVPGLREIIVAGEALAVSNSLRSYMTDNPQCKLWNHYGPTETHVASIAEVNVDENNSSQAIGFVIPNLTAFVLDTDQQILPLGAVGELYIGGVGLATGYLNQPELTQQQFIPSPYSDSETLYRTGDLVRYLDDGQLAFMGRQDNQVKIRGFRIELGEVEQQLNSLAVVQTSVVSVHESASQQKQLIAHICCTTSNSSNETELLDQIKEALQDSLPDYMVPNHLIIVSKMPLTANGKINRKALPMPEFIGSPDDYVVPTGQVETAMVNIWSQLLNIPAKQISAKANFFELGGHSLLVARLINEVQQSMDTALSYPVVFTKNTLRKISAEVEHQLKTKKLVESLSASNDDSIEEMEW